MAMGSVPPPSRDGPALEAKRAARVRNGVSRDATNVSTERREISSFDTAAKRAAERNRLVSRLKSAVDAGTYRPDPAAIAKAMGRRSDA
jgi:anti-sigma28 factor (negative regulator of flagellin synthesis)